MAHKKLGYSSRPAQLPLDSTSSEITAALSTLNTSGMEGVLDRNSGGTGTGTVLHNDDTETGYQPNNPNLFNEHDLNLNLTYSSPTISPPPSSDPSTAANLQPVINSSPEEDAATEDPEVTDFFKKINNFPSQISEQYADLRGNSMLFLLS